MLAGLLCQLVRIATLFAILDNALDVGPHRKYDAKGHERAIVMMHDYAKLFLICYQETYSNPAASSYVLV